MSSLYAVDNGALDSSTSMKFIKYVVIGWLKQSIQYMSADWLIGMQYTRTDWMTKTEHTVHAS